MGYYSYFNQQSKEKLCLNYYLGVVFELLVRL